METLQKELSLSRQRSLELEGRVAEFGEQFTSLRNQNAEAERQLALLRGEQDATCAEAFQLGMEDVRAKIVRAHPEWDLSFLEMEGYDVRTPGAELSAETEYEEVSDIDIDALLGDDAAVDSGADKGKGKSHPSDTGASETHHSASPGPSHASPQPSVDGSDGRGST